MIVESIRLQHIKSYGGGPAGNGVTVAFQPGVNRIAGVNGSGKTTIVEALGYALFSALPVFEENFKAETYLLAHGAKAGEIDVTFSVDGSLYRLERGVGQQTKRRSKVVDLADDSICAEGDREVDAFLCALLKLPAPERLTELFSKLVGVKQGRLVWPFDSKPKNAKDFFEPLLEVEVFRQCFDRLKPVVDGFVRDRGGREVRQAVLFERIREGADAGAKLEAAGQKVETHAARLEVAAKALEKAQAERTRHEGLEREMTEAASAREQAVAAAQFAAQSRQEAEGRVRESDEAVRRVNASEPGYQAYRVAEEALGLLEERRKTRDQLRRERETLCADVTRLTSKRDAAREQRDLLLGQQKDKRAACETAADDLSALNDELTSTADAFEREQRETETAVSDAAVLAAWVKALPSTVGRMTTLASGIIEASADLNGWDPHALAAAGEARATQATLLDEARAAAARTEERMMTLREQLERLADGVCPFLGERCEQFDSGKVENDLSNLEAALAEDLRTVEAAKLAHEQAEALHVRLLAQENRLKVKREQLKRDLAAYAGEVPEVVPALTAEALEGLADTAPELVPALAIDGLNPASAGDVEEVQRSVERFAADVAAWWAGTRERIDARSQAAALAKTERTRKETDARNLAARVRSLEEEVQALGVDAAAREAEAKQLDGQLDSRSGDVAGLDERLKPFDGLDAEFEVQRRAVEDNKDHYEAYLSARPLADDIEERRDRLEALQRGEEAIAATLATCEQRLDKARGVFVPDELAAAKAECDSRSGDVAGAKADLLHARDEQAIEKQRFGEWQAAVAESTGVGAEIARYTAAIDVTELARKTLRDAAPAVAQHLCARIADRAQAVYNQINPDPLELTWDAERYGLRITPGDRRFAMLSGGEQTKLALAMTLAMVEEFSRLRFCIFDEPTYGVDADSRRKLADAILQVQDAAGLDQLLLVSHDDAFEGRIEHTVLLTKSAAGGTAVEGP